MINLIRLSHRDLFSQKKQVLFLILNLTLGFLGLFFLENLKEVVQKQSHLKSKEILGADLAVSARRLFNQQELQIIKKELDSFETSDVLELYSMVATEEGESRLTEVKAIDDRYPLYGGLKLSDGLYTNQEKKLILNPFEVWISEDLKFSLNKKRGDILKIGEKEFKVSQIILDDSSSSWRGFSLAPRVYVRIQDLKQTGLVRYGSTLAQVKLFRIEEQKQSLSLKTELQKKMLDPAIKVRVPSETSEQVSRVFRYLSYFLGLTSLVALLLVALSLIFLFKNLIQKRLNEMATLKSMGMGHQSIAFIYCYQVFLLSVVAAGLAEAFNFFLLPLFMGALGEFVKIEGDIIFDFSSMIKMTILGFLFCLSVCWPLIRKVSYMRVNSLFQESRFDFTISIQRWFDFIPSFICFILLSIWQSQSIKLGLIFSATFIGAIAFSFLLGLLFLSFLAKIVKKCSFPYEVSIALKMMLRKKMTTLLSVAVLSLSSLLIVLILQVKEGLNQQLSGGDESERPHFFIFDIQEEQVEELQKLVSSKGISLENLSPMIRARILQVNGETFQRVENSDFETQEDEAQRRMTNRGVNLTYRRELDSSEEIVEGESFALTKTQESDTNFVSIEQRYAQRLNLHIGDELVFDIQGVEIKAVIKNFRKVRWTSFKPNFFIQFQDGVLNEAPKTFIATIRHSDKNLLRQTQRLVVRNLPNLSLIDVSVLIKKIREIFHKILEAVMLMTYLCLFVGLIVFFSLMSSQSREKAYDIGILKTLGSSNQSLNRWVFCEISILCFSFVVIGVLLGAGTSHIFLKVLFDADFVFNLREIPLYLLCYMLLSFMIPYIVMRQLTSLKTKNLVSY